MSDPESERWNTAGRGRRGDSQTPPHSVAAPWLVALDVDGTIIHEDETLTEPVRAAVARVRDAGHAVTLATGRSWDSTRPILDRLALAPEYVVCANGAVTLIRDLESPGGYRRDLVETFDPGPVLDRIRAGLPDGRFMVEDAAGHRFYTEGMHTWELEHATLVDFSELAHTPVARVVVVSPDHEPQAFVELVDSLGLHQVSYAIGWTAWLDIAPDGVNKGTALERVRGLLEVPSDRVLVVGDGRNDIEMFEWAAVRGRAVAMGQAPPELQMVATEITGDVWSDGLVGVLDSLPG